MVVFPGTYLVRWCYNLPAGCGIYIAHLYLLCTATDMSPLFLEGNDIWREFQNKIERADMPIRMAVTLTSAMSSISFILKYLASLDMPSAVAFPVPLSTPRPTVAGSQVWLELAESLEELSQKLCGPQHVAQWLRDSLNG